MPRGDRSQQILSVKVNASDFDGAHDDAARLRTVLEILDDDPLVRLDLAEVSGGTYEAGVACLGASADFPGTGPRLKFAPHVSELRRSTSLKAALMLAGGVSDRASASDALQVADVAGVARAACVDPACASKWLHNQNAVTLKPPKFGEMPSWLGGRRVWVPGLNYGWHQRQLPRLAQGRDAIVLSHWPFCCGCRACEPRRARAPALLVRAGEVAAARAPAEVAEAASCLSRRRWHRVIFVQFEICSLLNWRVLPRMALPEDQSRARTNTHKLAIRPNEPPRTLSANF